MSLFRRAKRIFESRKEKKMERKTIHNLEVDDIVSYYEQDFIVKGKIEYREGGDEWFEYRLVDGEDVRWLGIEEDDGWEITMYEEARMRVPRPVPDEISYEGSTYELEEHGVARAILTGETGNRKTLECEYWDFEDEDEDLLSIERWGGEYEVCAGKYIEEHEMEIYPGTPSI